MRLLAVGFLLVLVTAPQAGARGCPSVRVNVTPDHPARTAIAGCAGTYTAHIRVNGGTMPMADVGASDSEAVFYGMKSVVKVRQRGATIRVLAQTVARHAYVRVWFVRAPER